MLVYQHRMAQRLVGGLHDVDGVDGDPLGSGAGLVNHLDIDGVAGLGGLNRAGAQSVVAVDDDNGLGAATVAFLKVSSPEVVCSVATVT